MRGIAKKPSSRRRHGVDVERLYVFQDCVSGKQVDLQSGKNDELTVLSLNEALQIIRTNLQALKIKLIDAGVKGKLTEHFASDGTAQDLIAEILKEREELSLQGLIKADKTETEIFSSEIPYDIPNNWQWVRLELLGANIETPFADGPFGSNLKTEHYQSVDECYNELDAHYDDKNENMQWLKNNKDMFLAPTSDESCIIRSLFEKPKMRENIHLKNILENRPSADPYIAAKAKALDGIVVTAEEYKPHSSQLPNACEELDVKCISYDDFMEIVAKEE